MKIIVSFYSFAKSTENIVYEQSENARKIVEYMGVVCITKNENDHILKPFLKLISKIILWGYD